MRNALIAISFLALVASAAAVEHPVSVLGRVYIDTNCNGCIDSGDVLVNGVSIQLIKDNNVLGTAETGEFGQVGVYAFPSDLAPIAPITGSTYTLNMLLPSGYAARNAVPGPFSQRVTNSTLRFNLPTSVVGTSSSYDFLLKLHRGFFTFSQCHWGSSAHGCGSHGRTFLEENYADVYGTDVVMVGGNKTLSFTSARAIQDFLPQNGSARVLTASAVNPRNSISGLAGEVLAVKLAVDFSDAGVTTAFLGDLHIRYGPMEDLTVRQALAIANNVLGGNLAALPVGMSLNSLCDVMERINDNFDGGDENHRYLVW